MDVGDRIAHWRKVRGWSRAELAERVGVSAPAVYQWEGSAKIEKIIPSTVSLHAVAKACGITIQQFYGPLPKLAKQAKAL